MNYNNHRNIARITLEAETPLAISSGDKSLVTDSSIMKDVNSLPYIPGTSLAGALRNMLEVNGVDTNILFGYQMQNDGAGSRLIVSDAKMVGCDGNVVDGLKSIDYSNAFYNQFLNLPLRHHARMSDKGTVSGMGKYDEEIVYKGTRFCFEVEIVSSTDESDYLKQLIKCLNSEILRIGGGSRKGFGKLKIIKCEIANLDLTKPEDLNSYLSKSSDLSYCWTGYEPYNVFGEFEASQWKKYVLSLTPSNFFLFAAGYGDDEADLVPLKETVVKWVKGKGLIKDEYSIIPASSVKGAVSHRIAYHYNKLNNWTVESGKAKVGEDNPAVLSLFGGSKDKKCRGNVIISDVFLSSAKTKLFNHVAIDKITGGAKKGALFDEKVCSSNSFELIVMVDETVLKKDSLIEKALENTLSDICSGLLPLGGGTNKGYGTFKGKIN